MKINGWTIAALASLALTVIFLCLIGVSNIFGLLSSITLLLSTAILSVMAVKRYRKVRTHTKSLRYRDAYLYADELDDPAKIHEFRYDKKTERSLRWQHFNQLLFMITPITLAVISVYLVILSIRLI